MQLFNPVIFFIARRYIKGSKKQRFASFVALLAILGIAIGVCALIVVSSIMEGLQNRLKNNILDDCADVVVKATPDDIPYLLGIEEVYALLPFVQGEAMIQYKDMIAMVTLQGARYESLYLSSDFAQSLGLTSENRKHFLYSSDDDVNLQFIIHTPKVESNGYSFGSLFNYKMNSYQIAINQNTLNQLGIYPDFNQDIKVRLISTQNARYTPFGMTPVQRNFLVTDVLTSLDNSLAPTVIANYDDVRRFFRLKDEEMYYRLYLNDPFLIDNVIPYLEGRFEYTDWRVRYGDFFKAVGLEKIAMSTMLCLIILVASFNILSSLTMVVSSRVSEIAILKTIGLNNLDLLFVFLIVGMSTSVIGSIFGVIVGIPLALNAQSILDVLGISIVQGTLPIEINVFNILFIMLFCWLISILCTIYPAYQASKTDPARSLVVSAK